jgi:hypothetical protein
VSDVEDARCRVSHGPHVVAARYYNSLTAV